MPDAKALTILLMLTFLLAGPVHVAWMRLPLSRRFAQPLDGGARFRGRRLFGANKTLRGFMALVPTVGALFGLIGLGREVLPTWLTSGTWEFDPWTYAAIGAWVAMGFMAGELPNSFLKRQMDVPPGGVPQNPVLRVCCGLLDRVDSLLGALLCLGVVAPLPPMTWVYVLLAFPPLHFGFSAALYGCGVKSRMA
jgi:CDP-2,3-bis-(O-geranylgeranyl)-sn-glycerol synthase